jgi:hypothetical protein
MKAYGGVDMLGGPQSRSGWFGENSWSYRDSNFDHSVVQPVASRYTDYAAPAPMWEIWKSDKV